VTLYAALRTAVGRELGSAVQDSAAVSGGCISDAYRCRLADGRAVFVKAARAGAAADMFAQEALGLRRIEETATVRVPRVLGVAPEWLALEWLEPRGQDVVAWQRLGEELAALHAVRDDRPGWESDNYIGSLPQRNEPSATWAEFWRDRRLAPQLSSAAERLGARMTRDFDPLMSALDERLAAAQQECCSLLHGDLWHGNVHFTDGRAALIDPACSQGHREVDLAMAALFGGFDVRFTDAYCATWPLLPGAAERMPIYQLYYLLVHVNLFGGDYVAQTRAALRRVL
jgi:protein-ribulosamine 3-kinase